MIEGTQPYCDGEFEAVYASSYYFNEKGVAIWPAQVVNFTNKTQFLFRIKKGMIDVNDPGVNKYIEPENIRVPFDNFIYIGDSDTDVPCMKLVNSYGGSAIGVYNPETNDKQKVYRMIKENRIKYFAPADYTDGSALDVLVKEIINCIEVREQLNRCCYESNQEAIEASKDHDSEEIDSIIDALSFSRSFRTTHTLIFELDKIKHKMTTDQKMRLINIANDNYQIHGIINDQDLHTLFSSLISDLSDDTQAIISIKSMMC